MNFSILVGSCDKYSPLWPKFSYLFNKYWDKKIDVKKYIITETLDANIDGFETIKVQNNKNENYTVGLKIALDQIQADNVLWLQDDYFFRKTIEYDEFVKYYNFFIHHGMWRFGIHDNSDIYHTTKIGKNLYLYNQFSNYTISMQASLWNLMFLKSFVNRKESIWDFEIEGSKRLNSSTIHRMCFAAQENPWYLEACKKGEFTKEYYKICKEEGLDL